MDNPEGRKRKGRASLKKAAAAGGLLGCVLMCLVLWRVIQPGAYAQDPNAEPIAVGREANIEKLQNQLQSQADESSFRLRINGVPRVRGDQAELLLGNPAENNLCLSVSIVLNEDKETLYESGTLVPGAQVLTAGLNKTLSPGEYPATAVCRAIDPSTGETVGTPIRADLTLDVVDTDQTVKTP